MPSPGCAVYHVDSWIDSIGAQEGQLIVTWPARRDILLSRDFKKSPIALAALLESRDKLTWWAGLPDAEVQRIVREQLANEYAIRAPIRRTKAPHVYGQLRVIAGGNK
jgi:hypothetical protein